MTGPLGPPPETAVRGATPAVEGAVGGESGAGIGAGDVAGDGRCGRVASAQADFNPTHRRCSVAPRSCSVARSTRPASAFASSAVQRSRTVVISDRRKARSALSEAGFPSARRYESLCSPPPRRCAGSEPGPQAAGRSRRAGAGGLPGPRALGYGAGVGGWRRLGEGGDSWRADSVVRRGRPTARQGRGGPHPIDLGKRPGCATRPNVISGLTRSTDGPRAHRCSRVDHENGRLDRHTPVPMWTAEHDSAGEVYRLQGSQGLK